MLSLEVASAGFGVSSMAEYYMLIGIQESELWKVRFDHSIHFRLCFPACFNVWFRGVRIYTPFGPWKNGLCSIKLRTRVISLLTNFRNQDRHHDRNSLHATRGLIHGISEVFCFVRMSLLTKQ